MVGSCTSLFREPACGSSARTKSARARGSGAAILRTNPPAPSPLAGDHGMPIRFRCTFCNRLLGIATRKAGTETTCPHCGYAIMVPVPAEDEAKTERVSVDDVDQLLGNHVTERIAEPATQVLPPPRAEPPKPAPPKGAVHKPRAKPPAPPVPEAPKAAPKPPADPNNPPLFEGDFDDLFGDTATAARSGPPETRVDLRPGRTEPRPLAGSDRPQRSKGDSADGCAVVVLLGAVVRRGVFRGAVSAPRATHQPGVCTPAIIQRPVGAKNYPRGSALTSPCECGGCSYRRCTASRRHRPPLRVVCRGSRRLRVRRRPNPASWWRPFPATVVTIPVLASIRRIVSFSVSAMNTFPFLSMSISFGPSKVASSALPLSPV